MNECIFCKIISSDIPSTQVYEDNEVLAFLDITPVNPGHTLVVPKKHSTNVLDADNETLAILFPVVKRVANAVRKGMGAEGINIHINNGSAAGQVVPHLHIHVIPRYANDGLHLWKGDEKKYSEDAAQQIKDAL